MNCFKTIAETKAFLSECKEKDSLFSIGFVPTMGALHQGHISLIEQSKKSCSLTICSIFVNPVQFNNTTDLEKYPRTPAQDLLMLKQAGCDVVFMPEVGEIYPEENKEFFNFNGLDQILEGKFRPGHFQGVAMVVKRFFEIIQPDKAFFGEKDFQQLTLIKHLVKKQKIPVQIIPCETVREADGLAMSSRNSRLSSDQRKNAPVIYQNLLFAKENYKKISISEIKEQVKIKINTTPEMQLEYFEIVDSSSLKVVDELSKQDDNEKIACIALVLGEVRLIDNIKI